jgi:hypothetical protein
MSDDVQVVVSSYAAPTLSPAAEVEASTNQDALAVADEEQEDALPENEMLEASPEDASLDDPESAGEYEAGNSAAPVPTPLKHEAAAEEPYDFDRCTIQIGLQLLPDDGDPAGRPVVVGVRNHADAPIVTLTRLATLGPLPQLVAEMLDCLRAELPARKTAKEEAAARKKAEQDAARARREAAKSKPKSSNAKPAPKKVNTLDQAPESGPAPSSVTIVTAPTFDASQASEQISLF